MPIVQFNYTTVVQYAKKNHLNIELIVSLRPLYSYIAVIDFKNPHITVSAQKLTCHGYITVIAIIQQAC